MIDDTTHLRSPLLGQFGHSARAAIIQVLWFLVFLSWVPVIGTNSLDIGVLLSGEGCVYLPMPVVHMFAGGPLKSVPVSDLGLLLAVGGVIAAALRTRALSLALIAGLGIEGVRFVTGCGDVSASEIYLVPRQVAVALSFTGVALSILIFVIHGHVLSAGFVALGVLVIWEAMASAAGATVRLDEVPSMLSLIFEGSAPNPAIFLCVTLSLVIARVLCRIVQDNEVIIMQLRIDGRLIVAMFQAFRLWLPILGIFLVLALGYNTGWRLIDHHAGAMLVKNSRSCQPMGDVSVAEAIDCLDKENIRFLRKKFQDSLSGADALAMDTAKKIYTFVEVNLPGRAPGTTTEECKFFDFVCRVTNLAKSIANSIYQTLRQNFLEKLKTKLEGLEREVDQGAEAFRERAMRDLDSALTDLRARSKMAIGLTFATLRALSFALLLYSLLVLLKTYLIVLARVVLHTDWGLVAKLEDGSAPNTHGDARASKDGYLWFGKDRRDVLFAAHDIEVVNAPSGGRIPMPFTAILSRLVNRTWRMQRIDLGKRRSAVALTRKHPACLVEWTLRCDECVLFHPAHFAGFAEGTRIKRLVSFNLANVIFGRVITHCAIGQGTLLLRTRNTAILSRSTSGRASVRAGRSYKPRCFVARDIRAGFCIDSDLNDVMRGNLTLRKLRGDNVVIDTEADKGLRGGFGLLRHARTFLVPF